jgi:PIN like domain
MNEPHELTYFIDRDLGLRFSQALQSAGLRVERADDHFRNDAPDDVWLPIVASRGWVAVTRDGRIRYSPLALAALMNSGARLFVIVGKLKAAETAEVFLRHRKKVERVVAAETAAFIAKIRRDGVTIWLRHKAWAQRRR